MKIWEVYSGVEKYHKITSIKTGNFWKLKKFVKPFVLSAPWVFAGVRSAATFTT